MQMTNGAAIRKYGSIIKMLKEGKSIKPIQGYMLYRDEDNVSHKVKYIYSNEQFNRTEAVLENGEIVKYPIDIFHVYYIEWEEYKEKTIVVTRKEIENKFGCKVIIEEE